MKFQMNITTSYDDVCRFFSADDLKSFYKSHGCDGLEVMPLDNYDPADLEHPIPPEECSLIRSSMVRGVHCCCLGDWMEKDREELIRHYRKDLDYAKWMGAEYVVFHVVQVNDEEGFTYVMQHEDREVLTAAASFINELLEGQDYDFWFLMENLWWPGLNFLSPEDTLTVYLDTLQKLDLKEMTSYLGVVNIMNTSDTAKNSIASALAEQIHKNFNYVIKSSSENGYNATVTTEITTFDSDSILADYQEKLDKYLASADAVIDGSQKRYEKSFEILLNSINDNTVTTVNDVDFVLINDGVSWKLQDEGNTLGNAIFGTLTDSPLETSDSEDENISADTDKQTDDNTSTESSSN